MTNVKIYGIIFVSYINMYILKGVKIMPGKNKAIASLVCGILSILLFWAGYGALVGVVLGIVAIVLAISAKKEGCEDGMQKAGFILGIIGTILSGIVFVSCVLCAGAIAAASSSFNY